VFDRTPCTPTESVVYVFAYTKSAVATRSLKGLLSLAQAKALSA